MMRQVSTRGGNRASATVFDWRYLAVAVLAVLTAACATLSPSSPKEEKVKVVSERAQARWKAIIGKDFASAYEYLSPKSRATVTPAGFKTIVSRLNYRDAKVTGVTCDGEACAVKLLITYDAHVMNGVHTPLEESWVITRGQAWYVWVL